MCYVHLNSILRVFPNVSTLRLPEPWRETCRPSFITGEQELLDFLPAFSQLRALHYEGQAMIIYQADSSSVTQSPLALRTLSASSRLGNSWPWFAERNFSDLRHIQRLEIAFGRSAAAPQLVQVLAQVMPQLHTLVLDIRNFDGYSTPTLL